MNSDVRRLCDVSPATANRILSQLVNVIKEVEQLLETKNLKVEASFGKDCWLLEKHAPAGGSANFNDLLRKALMFLYFYSAAYKWLSEMRFNSSDLTSFVKSDEEVNGYYKIYILCL